MAKKIEEYYADMELEGGSIPRYVDTDLERQIIAALCRWELSE